MAPGAIHGVNGPSHPSEPFELLYVGIAPKDGRSRATLRSRIHGQHLGGNIGSRTFRHSLAALLFEAMGWTTRWSGSRAQLSREDNGALSDWQTSTPTACVGRTRASLDDRGARHRRDATTVEPWGQRVTSPLPTAQDASLHAPKVFRSDVWPTSHERSSRRRPGENCRCYRRVAANIARGSGAGPSKSADDGQGHRRWTDSDSTWPDEDDSPARPSERLRAASWTRADVPMGSALRTSGALRSDSTGQGPRSRTAEARRRPRCSRATTADCAR